MSWLSTVLCASSMERGKVEDRRYKLQDRAAELEIKEAVNAFGQSTNPSVVPENTSKPPPDNVVPLRFYCMPLKSARSM
jgi:hypothetical protein